MRLFIGIDIPKEVKDNLFNIQKIISGDIAKIKWVEKKNLHITLKFLGNVEKSNLNKIKEKLDSINFNEFKLKFKKIDFFYRYDKLSILKLSFYNSSILKKLQRKIDENLIEIFPEPQKFTLYLTLGRIKLVKKEEKLLKRINNFNFFKNEFNINKFQLVQSISQKGRQIYKTIYEFKP